LAQIQNNDRAIDSRTREVNDIAKSIYALAEIFRDLQTLVIDQGTLLDRIDYNIEQVTFTMKAANEELIVVCILLFEWK
jgi:syntaxin 16